MSETTSEKPAAPSGPGGRSRRSIKRFLINPEFQFSFLAYFALFCELNLLVIYISVVYFWRGLANRAEELQIAANPDTLRFFESSKGMFKIIFLAASAESFVILLIGGIILSHRIAGPLWRVENALRAIAAGRRPEPLQFRDSDYFGRIQVVYNDAMRRLIEHGVPPEPGSQPPV